MAIDRKYGRVSVEKGSIGEDEPVVVFRAQDGLLPRVLEAYAALCIEEGSPHNHIAGIELARREIDEWQQNNFTKIPTSS